MSNCKEVGIGLLVATMVAASQARELAYVVQSAREATDFPQATLACKVTMGAITETESGSPNGTKCDAVCAVMSPLKGELGKEVQITFRRHGNGRRMPGLDAVKAGGVYVIMLRGSNPPDQMFAA